MYPSVGRQLECTSGNHEPPLWFRLLHELRLLVKGRHGVLVVNSGHFGVGAHIPRGGYGTQFTAVCYSS